MTLVAGPAGQTCFTGDIIDDALALEPVEQFTLQLRDQGIQNVLIGNDETVVRIIDDDGKCVCGKVFFIYMCSDTSLKLPFFSKLFMCVYWGGALILQ